MNAYLANVSHDPKHRHLGASVPRRENHIDGAIEDGPAELEWEKGGGGRA